MGLENFFHRYHEAVQRDGQQPKPLDVLRGLGLDGSENLADDATGNLTPEAIESLGDDFGELLRLYEKMCRGLNCPRELERFKMRLIDDGSFDRLRDLDKRRDPWAQRNDLAAQRLPSTGGNVFNRKVHRGPGRYSEKR